MKIIFEKFGVKIFLAYALFIFFISLVFTVFYIHHQSGFLTETLINEGRLLSGILAFNSRIGVFSENRELLKDPVEAIIQNKGVLEICVYNLDGQLLEHRKKSGRAASEDSPRNPDIFETLNSSNAVFQQKHKNSFEFWSPVISGARYVVKESVLLEDNPVRENLRRIGFVKVRLDRRRLNQQIRDLLYKSIGIMIVFLIIGSGLSYVAAHSITRPLNRLTDGVNAFGRGGMIQKVPVETRDEIGKLAEAFNNLYVSLSRRENELKISEARLRTLSSQLLSAQERERKRVSRELHDELGQALALLKHRIRSVQRKLPSDQAALRNECEDTSRYIDQIIEDVRRLSRDLRPSILEDLGFSAALGWMIQNFEKQYSIQTIVNMENIDDLFSRQDQTIIYRIFQEALTNIGKHARAGSVRFEIKNEEHSILCQIYDDGQGFDVHAVLSEDLADKGMGLAAMQERAHMLGAHLGITSQAGKGTTIMLKIPIKKEA